jgi:hypothetical protein
MAPLAIVWALTIAGCSGPSEGTGGPSASPDAAGAPFAVAAEWSAGQWWEYSTQSPAGAGEPFTLVVADNGSAGYVVATTSRSLALFDAENDTSFIGPIAPEDLSGRQGDDVVQYFQFPLEPDKNWTTPWDGVERVIRAVGSEDGVFALEAYENDTLRVRYTYDADAGFFGAMEFLDDAGAPSFRIALTDYGTGFDGTLVAASVEEKAATLHPSGSTAYSPFTGFDIEDTVGELYLSGAFFCESAAGFWSIEVSPDDPEAPEDQTYALEGTCPDNRTLGVLWTDPVAGAWNLATNWFPLGTPSHFEVRIDARTYTEAPFP